MRRYEGRVSLGGTTHDADVTAFKQFDVQPGLFLVALLDGTDAGLRAAGELEYPEGSKVFPHRVAPATIQGRTPFSSDPHSG